MTTKPHDLSLAGRSIREVIRAHGLERLRGQPIVDGPRVLYIADSDLDDAITLWEDEPDAAGRHKRFYGSVVHNDPHDCLWIYANAVVATAEQVAHAHQIEDSHTSAPTSEDATEVPHADLILAALKGQRVEWLDETLNEWVQYQSPREAIHALTLTPHRRVQLVAGLPQDVNVPLNLFVHADIIRVALEGKLVQWFNESLEKWVTCPMARDAVLATVAFPDRRFRAPGSWVIRNIATRELIMETYSPKLVRALNTSKYEAVAIDDYLASLNRSPARESMVVRPRER
jgi:hypothetical protein